MTRFGRLWLVFAALAIATLGSDFAYLKWRERSHQPLGVPIDLTRPGTYTFHLHGLAASPYIPQIQLQLPFKPDAYNWFPDDGYRQLWADSPPEIGIEVLDAEGRRVLSERGTLTRSDGWIVTGSVGSSVVGVYKLSKINGRPFDSYRVSLTVFRGSPKAATYRPWFQISEVPVTALLPSVLGFYALIAAIVLTAMILGLLHLLSSRRKGLA